jgi:hypothetical protein
MTFVNTTPSRPSKPMLISKPLNKRLLNVPCSPGRKHSV